MPQRCDTRMLPARNILSVHISIYCERNLDEDNRQSIHMLTNLSGFSIISKDQQLQRVRGIHIAQPPCLMGAFFTRRAS